MFLNTTNQAMKISVSLTTIFMRKSPTFSCIFLKSPLALAGGTCFQMESIYNDSEIHIENNGRIQNYSALSI